MKMTGTHLGILVIALYFSAQACMANDISIAQIGDDFTLTVVQDGKAMIWLLKDTYTVMIIL